ncbi:EAL domain-containing protein [Pengzhenrongella sicca]|uniref:EAL domain-containing protein n=1 Tax=Pengzhenrongella sicca TaxID=2819238 RepID=A0A8A4ZBL0_9MICO|nr:EAL domain-containing protein [Pengzhenrongella sicca]QTE28263.1 EAL domain-containing protein [Pengzhenrongella sicca]
MPGPSVRAAERASPAAPPWLWLAFLAVAGVLAVAFFALPALGPLLWAPLGLLSVAATVAGVRLNRPRQAAGWYLLAGAQFTLFAGDTAYSVLTGPLGQLNPYPSVADLFYLLTYPLAAAGIYLFIRGRSATHDRASLIDAVIITTGIGLLVWVYLVLPNYEAPGSGIGRVVSVAYPLGDVLVIAMLARLVTAGGLRFRAMQLLIVGAGGLLVADILYGLGQLAGAWQTGGPIDAGWILFYVGWGAAALHPSMIKLAELAPRPSTYIGPARVSVLAGVTLISPTVLLAEATRGGVVHASTVALFSTALFLLVIARLWGLLEVHQQSVQRERILRTSGEALVSAHGLEAIYQVALDGVAALTGTGGSLAGAAIFVASPTGVQCVAASGVPLDDGAVDRFWLTAAAGGCLDPAGTVSVTSFRSDRADRGMLVVESTSAMTSDTHGAFATLAAQVALAVESAKLAEDLRRRRSDKRYRGILQAASDIIVVVTAEGEITYGTPSLGRNLGHDAGDVVGRDIVEFLHPSDAGEARAIFAAFGAGTSHAQAIADWHLRRHDGSFVAFEVLSDNLLRDPSVGGILLTMRDVSERRALEVELKHQAFHDALTGLPNRALFHDRAEHALARTSRQGSVLAVLMIDLDDFKEVNDTRGHASGDDLLIQIAARLAATCRSGSTVSRFGGDEFAVLVEDLADVGEAEIFADRVLATFATPFVLDGEATRIGASVGVVVTGGPHEKLAMTELMRCADLALYAAKDLGKGQARLYHRDLSTKMLDRLAQRSDLERGLAADEFLVHYQPIVSIETGRIAGCEALVRWEHPERGLVSPYEFIPLAEETGLIVALGRLVFDKACAQMHAWLEAGYCGLRLSVNVSARELHEKHYLEDVRTALRKHSIPPTILVLELTESIFALNDPTISSQLSALREAGIKIAMDDFGTGYSSLSYLQKFQLDVLKVDKSFVDGLGVDDLDAGALVSAIITLGHSLRLEVVAEGIERVDQRDELAAMGCGLGQGYLYSRPVTADRMSDLLAAGLSLDPIEAGRGVG